MGFREDPAGRIVFVCIVLTIFLILSIPLHEYGHWLSYRSVGIDAHIEWFPRGNSIARTIPNLDSAEAADIWLENRIFISAAGGLFSFLVLLIPALLIDPLITAIPFTQLGMALLEPVNSWTIGLGYGCFYCDVAVSIASLIIGFSLAINVNILSRWIHEI